MTTRDRPGSGWTLVLRRQPARIVAGQEQGGYTEVFEIICPECGDHPDLDYGEVSSELRQIRGPYLAASDTSSCPLSQTPAEGSVSPLMVPVHRPRMWDI